MRTISQEVYEVIYQYVLRHHGGSPFKLVELIEEELNVDYTSGIEFEVNGGVSDGRESNKDCQSFQCI